MSQKQKFTKTDKRTNERENNEERKKVDVYLSAEVVDW
jgi:hypothetical protein